MFVEFLYFLSFKIDFNGKKGVVKMKIKIAAVIGMGTTSQRNCDSFNINGRVPLMAEADGGYKAAGEISTPFVIGAFSGSAVGSAFAAANMLTEHAEAIKLSEEEYKSSFLDYLERLRNEVIRREEGIIAFSVALLYAYNDTIAVARLGKNRIYRFSGIELMSIPENRQSGGKQMNGGMDHYDDIKTEDRFLILGPGVVNALTESEITNIMATSSSVKDAAKRLFDEAREKNSQEDTTVIVFSVERELPPPVIPEGMYSAPPIAALKSEAPIIDGDEPVYASDDESKFDIRQFASDNKLLIGAIAVLLVVLVLMVAFILSRRSAQPAETTVETTTEEPTTEEVSGIVSEPALDTTVEETEETTEEPTTEATTEKQTTTTRRSTTTTTQRETTTSRQSTTTTERASESTTVGSVTDITEAPSESSTAAPGTEAPTTAAATANTEE